MFIIAPPSPLALMSHGGLDTGMQHHSIARSSPPLPPPPAPLEQEHPRFGVPTSSQALPILTDEPDLPGWVPKNYIEKGNNDASCIL